MITPPHRIFLVFCTAALILTGLPLHAQNGNNNFSLGNELLQEGEFEEAYRVFEKLMEENPGSYAVYDRAVTALVNMKRYEDAITLTRERLEQFGGDVNTQVKLGEIHHIAGNEEQAFEAWEQVLARHPDNPNAYRHIARTMNDRRLHREAIDVFERARRNLNAPTLFGFEIAENYLAVGDYEPALREFLDILGSDDRAKSRIQRQLLNYDERSLYDTAILLTEERLDDLSPGSERDLIYRDFLVWLNMERELYRRALAAARTMERYGENEQHIVFRVGRQLRSRGEFELAEEAFTYYLELEQHPLQARSYEELSRTYQERAARLVDNNMDYSGSADSLYRKAFDTVRRLTERYPRYERRMQTLVLQAELALDHLNEPEHADEYFEKMEEAAESEADEARLRYVEGRILLFRGEYAMARVAFTRSNRLADSDEIADKSRYYLGLGDFYNGDFEYARLQLRSLERENYSWFANNALQLRYLIQNAWEKDDDNTALKRYARARYHYDTGQYAEAAGLLGPVLGESASQPVYGETIQLLTRAIRRIHPETAYRVIDRYTGRPSVRQNAGEQLLWERARLAELVYVMQDRGTADEASLPVEPVPEVLYEKLPDMEELTGEAGSEQLLVTPGMVVESYEDLLMNYPDGFYAEQARRRIRDLEQPSREI